LNISPPKQPYKKYLREPYTRNERIITIMKIYEYEHSLEEGTLERERRELNLGMTENNKITEIKTRWKEQKIYKTSRVHLTKLTGESLHLLSITVNIYMYVCIYI
jgi:hypothetical protein